MNNKIIISTDCICDLSEDLIKKYSIKTVPFYITINGARFQDYSEINSAMLREYIGTDDIVSSSPASIDDYKKYFAKYANGNVTLIHISVSSKLSKAYANAVSAAKDFKNIHIIDSGSFSHGVGLLVLTAADRVNNNATVESICEELRKLCSRVSCSCLLKTTRYASYNDRLSSTLSYFLDLLKIKPTVKMKNKEVKVTRVCFLSMTSCAKRYIRSTLKNDKKICDDILFIAFSGCTEEFKQFVYNEATKRIKWKRVYMQDVSATNICNVGPESFGLIFFTK